MVRSNTRPGGPRGPRGGPGPADLRLHRRAGHPVPRRPEPAGQLGRHPRPGRDRGSGVWSL